MGGRTAPARDRLMEGLIDDHFAQAPDPRPHRADDRRGRGAARPAGQLASLAVAPGNVPARRPRAPPPARSRKATRIPRTSDAHARCRGGRPAPRPHEARRRAPAAAGRRSPPRRSRAASPTLAPPQRRSNSAGSRAPIAVAKGPSREDAAAPAPATAPGRRRRRTIAAATTPAPATGGLEDPDRRDRRRRQGDRPARPGARPEPRALASAQAVHRENPQGRGRLLPRPVRRPQFGFRGVRLPLAEAQRLLLFCTRLTPRRPAAATCRCIRTSLA